MIVICVIVAVIGSFICALLKTKIDGWLEYSSMKGQSRLSLRRSHCSESQGTSNDLVEISDDESFDLPQNIQKSTREYTNVTSHETTNVLNNMTDAFKGNSNHDISDDLSSDEDVIIVDDVSNNTSNKSQSMFNWNKMFFDINPPYQNIFPESSVLHGSRKVIPIETKVIPNKRQKLMEALTSSNLSSSDDESIDLDIFKKNDLPLKGLEIQHDIMIAGTRVKFPAKPYSCQIAVMNSLILGCTKERNCLLESPTGSGKTLALLCGALAWQEQYSEKISREESDGMDAESSYCDNDAVNNFFLNPSQYFEKEPLPDEVSCKNKTKKVPKIYYGTRTHKQIEQVVREFKKTAYRHKRMTILSSRKQTCIQETDRNKDELCNELLDPLKVKKCQYFNEHSKKKSTIFSKMNTPWDIEDLVSLGNEIGACPYFGARSLMADAEIIFCPYNYILRPDIRESMQINLKGNIVILDEAHNVEDICREAASVNLKDIDIEIAAKECQNLLKKGRNRVIYSTIHEYLTDIAKFLKDIEVNENNFDEMISKHWLGTEFRVLLDVNNVGCPRFPDFLNASTAAIEDLKISMKEENPEKIKPTISQETKKILERLCFAMQMIASDIFVNDYRMYIIETNEITKKTVIENVWISAENVSVKVRTLKLICMNPAIVFVPLAHDVRSVILASGTLTPTTSFQSELGTQFSYRINPDHIIPKNQVYVRYITQGPNKKPLMAKYETVNTWDFQDELGNLILQVCDSVPHGVLCFFASYKILNTIHERWKKNGMWDKLSKLKKIFVEPRDNRKLPEVMREYRSVIEESSSKSFRTACGAILFAVFRGKVAEGIDFSDNEARCVLAIGIPYSFKGNDISMKMQYNDSSKSKNLLSGSQWYAVNAFRALNQAIGRCVRHKNDWGAVLLVDKRFQQSENINHLPKWIRTNLKYNEKYDLEIELQDFVVMQAARERGEKCVEN